MFRLLSFALVVGVMACTPREPYTIQTPQLVDPFEENKDTYLQALRIVRPAINNKYASVCKNLSMSPSNSSEQASIQFKNAVSTLESLAADQAHAPSIYTLGQMVVAGELSAKHLKVNCRVLTEDIYPLELPSSIPVERVMMRMEIAAKFGYEPARQFYRELGLIVPEKVYSTSKEEKHARIAAIFAKAEVMRQQNEKRREKEEFRQQMNNWQNQYLFPTPQPAPKRTSCVWTPMGMQCTETQ